MTDVEIEAEKENTMKDSISESVINENENLDDLPTTKLHDESDDLDQPLNLNFTDDDSFENEKNTGNEKITEEYASKKSCENFEKENPSSELNENTSDDIIQEENYLFSKEILNKLDKTFEEKLNNEFNKNTLPENYSMEKTESNSDEMVEKDEFLSKDTMNNSDNDDITDEIQRDRKKIKKKISAIIDSSDEEDYDRGKSEPEDDCTKKHIVTEIKETKTMTAKEAEEQRKQIRSVTQRLSRETQINIPYHKPKKFTLQEFLSRKTILKPTQILSNSKIACSQLKMTPEELEQYSQYLESRAKEATEFFKNEQETEDTNENEENKQQIEQIKNENEQLTTDNEQQKLPIEKQEKKSENSSLLDIENLRKLTKIDELPKFSKLKGDSNMLVDLETGKCISPKPSGVDDLLNKFLKHSAKRKPKSTVSVNILSTNNGTIEISNAKINVNDDDDFIKADQKPGLAYVKLKENLRNLITQKRKSELTKKIQESQIIAEKEKELENEEEVDYEEEEDEEDEEEVKDESGERKVTDEKMLLDEENEEYVENEDKNDELDDEDEENNADENDDNSEQSDADDELEDGENDSDNENFSKRKSKKRILRAFEDSDDENEDTMKDKDTSLVSNDEENFNNEKLNLDSSIEQSNALQNMPAISQIPTSAMTQEVDDNELMYLCSGTFTSNVRKESSPNKNLNLQVSDDEDENDFVVSNKNKKKKCGPIDDDDDDDSEKGEDKEEIKEQSDDDNDDENEEEENDEAIETYIDYDSEENEIEVKLTKNDRLKKAGEYFENEAELSESEWGSDDEDEKGMDNYDMELGDEDKFDQDELHDELEKIHMRKMLDQDIREVKKLQEMFFDDEENDGFGRQRQFKWKNLDNDFSLDNPEEKNNEENEQESGDEQNEEYWRKMRHERQQLLKEKNLTTEENFLIQNTSDGVKEIQLSHKKLTIMKPKDNATTINDIKSQFLISKSEKILKRSSFLGRDQETLKKLASFMKTSTEKDEDDEIMCVKTVNSKKFVFQVISNEENNTKTMKRKISTKDDSEDKGKWKKFRLADNNSKKKSAKT